MCLTAAGHGGLCQAESLLGVPADAAAALRQCRTAGGRRRGGGHVHGGAGGHLAADPQQVLPRRRPVAGREGGGRPGQRLHLARQRLHAHETSPLLLLLDLSGQRFGPVSGRGGGGGVHAEKPVSAAGGLAGQPAGQGAGARGAPVAAGPDGRALRLPGHRQGRGGGAQRQGQPFAKRQRQRPQHAHPQPRLARRHGPHRGGPGQGRGQRQGLGGGGGGGGQRGRGAAADPRACCGPGSVAGHGADHAAGRGLQPALLDHRVADQGRPEPSASRDGVG